MRHPDDIDVLFVDSATTALEYVRRNQGTPEQLAAAVVHVVHKAQRHQRLTSAAKLRLVLDGGDCDLGRRADEFAEDLERG